MDTQLYDSNREFQRYINRMISEFQPKEKDIENQNYEPDGCRLIFCTIKNIHCDYALEFEENGFFLKINYEIDDEKYPKLRNQFYEKLNFLFTDKRFYSHDEKSIVLKSEIKSDVIERAQIIFAMEKRMSSLFFPESKTVMDEIILSVFVEFKDIMRTIWKILDENYGYDFFENLTLESGNAWESLPEDISNDFTFLESVEKENPHNLPEEIKKVHDLFLLQQKKSETEQKTIIPRRKRNLFQKLYVFLKRRAIRK